MKHLSKLSLVSLLVIAIFSCKKENEENLANLFYNNIEFNKVIKSSSGYLLVGSSNDSYSKKDFLIAKFDDNYEKLWSYSYEIDYNQKCL